MPIDVWFVMLPGVLNPAGAADSALADAPAAADPAPGNHRDVRLFRSVAGGEIGPAE